MIFGLKDAGKGFKNDLEVAKMLDFEFFGSLLLKGPYIGHFKRFFFAIFFT